MEADVEAAIEVLYPVPFAIGVIFAGPVRAGLADVDRPLPHADRASDCARARSDEPLVRPADARPRPGGSRSASARCPPWRTSPSTGRSSSRRSGASARGGRLARRPSAADERVAAGYIRAWFDPALEALPTLAVVAPARDRVLAGLDRRYHARDPRAVVTLFGLLAWPMRFIGWILSELPRAVVGHGRILKSSTAGHHDAAGEPDLATARPARCPGRVLTYGFAGASVLDEVSFHVEPTSRSRSSGPRASASRTLAQLLVRLDDPADGRS